MYEMDYEVLTVNEVMEALQIGQNYTYSLLNSGKLKGYKVGRSWRIPRFAVNQFIESSIED